MAKRMLIDAAHPEETRVVVLNGSRLEEFDFESSTKKQIKGNIYLAKVTRVEPSLQAAFVEYGGNRHGFLAFNEIHPDYYRIPVADRQAALEYERAAEHAANAREDAEREHDHDHPHAADEAGADPHHGEHDDDNEPPSDPFEPTSHDDDDDEAPDLRMAHLARPETLRAAEPEREPADEPFYVAPEVEAASLIEPPWQDAEASYESPPEGSAEARDEAQAEPADGEPNPDDSAHDALAFGEGAAQAHSFEGAETHVDRIETVGGDEIEEAARPRGRPFRHYKIQEVIKRRQIMLVQVTKEERGNKGAALTTYVSLAGRYCVLMPNTPRGGGVSRKITNSTDRRRLKDLMSDLDVPEGMGVIVRTAGSERTKPEIKRDFEYLLRLWDEIRELTLKSTAPALIYEEGNLIKRAIRDLYARDIDEVVVDGDEGYRTAKTFMKMLMPSHAKRVKQYRDLSVPLFHRHQVEQQIDAVHSPIVQLRSGGYIVLNPTEALVAIDVNSGRSTKERNIEETALKTNLEAAEEVARQLRLRDLAGLVVIDFIDMEEYRNRGAVERRLKDAMRYDRARIQLGRISPFGLLELSRQRLRPSLVEASTETCPHCQGSGHIRSIESTALHVLRAIEEEGMRRRSAEVEVAVPTKVALYILNQKRTTLQLVEAHSGMSVSIGSDDTLVPPAFRLDRLRALTPQELAALPTYAAPQPEPEEDDEPVEDEGQEGEPAQVDESEALDEETEAAEPQRPPQAERADSARAPVEDNGRNRRRRRSRPGRSDDRHREQPRPQPPRAVEPQESAEDEPAVAPPHPAETREPGESQSDAEHRRRRRGRRGGRRRRRDGDTPHQSEPGSAASAHGDHEHGLDDAVEINVFEPNEADPPETEIEPELPLAERVELVPPQRGHDEAARDVADAFGSSPAPAKSGSGVANFAIAEGAPETAPREPAPTPTAEPHPPEPAQPPPKARRGWWRR